MSDQPIRFGHVGLGGWGGSMCDKLLAESDAPDSRLKMVVACDPEPDRFPERVRELQRRGIVVVRTLQEVLERDIDTVYLPVPIELHRSFTEQSLRAGKAVLCEKPAAGAVDDVDAMIAARDAAGLPVAIAYQDVYQSAVQQIKRRLLSGEFGAIRRATVLACWPRSQRYYGRNTWAGRLRKNGHWILDSPACNAMAHFIHLALFLLGPSETESANPQRVEAELYRANPIENYDTCSLRVRLAGGSEMLVALTHACVQQIQARVELITERGQITYALGRQIEIRTAQRTETLALQRGTGGIMLRTLQEWRQGRHDRIGGTLEMARAHTVVINAASQAAPVVQLPESLVQIATDEYGSALRYVPGIESALRQSIAEGKMLHESGLVNWSVPAACIDCADYRTFAGPAQSPG
ncbi:Gfo/Idh/MocA family protein [Fontivita pretiosa]|uniref:Gfo/Idh/MocA family protein n=1 Tax=Fontivita pretiosa TaxID=2989684 RepID=UPI003D1813C5